MIVNIRGLSGSGKSRVVRDVTAGAAEINVMTSDRDGRRLASTYTRPRWHRPLTVIGCYGRTGGGCDALRQADGGLDRAVGLACDAVARGHHVLLEGNQLSFDIAATSRLCEAGELRIVLLLVPVPQCADNLRRRRRSAGSRIETFQVRLAGEARRLGAVLPDLSSLAGAKVVPTAGAGPAADLVDRWLSAAGAEGPGADASGCGRGETLVRSAFRQSAVGSIRGYRGRSGHES